MAYVIRRASSPMKKVFSTGPKTKEFVFKTKKEAEKKITNTLRKDVKFIIKKK